MRRETCCLPFPFARQQPDHGAWFPLSLFAGHAVTEEGGVGHYLLASLLRRLNAPASHHVMVSVGFKKGKFVEITCGEWTALPLKTASLDVRF
jgi:hypothetical protein